MPRRGDIDSILIIVSGPIVIGQACEFDYSGAQASKALKGEGYRIVLVNSNPATIMTDPELADATYIEPVTMEFVREVIAKERPQALLPTMGGQTALNVSVELAEDRGLFKKKMIEIGLDVPNSGVAHEMWEVKEIAVQIGFPIIIRPAFTLGGSGGGIAYNHEELDNIALQGLNASPVKEILLEESVLGWKEI